MRARLVALCLLAGALAQPGGAMAAAGAPVDLRVEDGNDLWRHTNSFRLEWQGPPPELATAPLAYEIFDPDGYRIVEQRTIAPGSTALSLQNLLPRPGAYRLELRYLAASGPGEAAPAMLRFDDVRPGSPGALPPPDWVGRNSFPLRIGIRPPASMPVSGLAGYAVAVGPDPATDPCRSNATCGADEIDLASGPAPAHLIHDLPAGRSWIHVVAVSGSGMRSLEPGRGEIRVDGRAPRTMIDGVPAGWVNAPVTLTVRADDDESGMMGDGSAPEPFTAVRINGAAPVASPGSTATVVLAAEGVHTVEHYARDEAGNVDDGGSTNGRANGEPGRAIVRIDRTPPTVAFAPAQDPADPELIVATVSDPASGPSLDRGSLAVRPVGSDGPFQQLPTRVAEGTLLARWNSADADPGLHEFRAHGLDRAGNRALGSARMGGTPMVLRAPLRTATALRIGRAEGGGRVSSRERRPRVRGRLSTRMGTAVPGAAVILTERAGPDGGERTRTVVTAPDGSFAATLRRGPSRSVAARFAGSATLAPARSEAAEILVRPRIRFGASSDSAAVGGRPVVFRGRLAVAAAELPAAGKAIALEFRLRTTAWTAFRTVRTDRRGRFRLPYRFEDDDSRGVGFRFRAVAIAEPGWHFERAASRAVAVRGR